MGDLLRDWLETTSYVNTPASTSPDRPWWSDPQYNDDPEDEADADEDFSFDGDPSAENFAEKFADAPKLRPAFGPTKSRSGRMLPPNPGRFVRPDGTFRYIPPGTDAHRAASNMTPEGRAAADKQDRLQSLKQSYLMAMRDLIGATRASGGEDTEEIRTAKEITDKWRREYIQATGRDPGPADEPMPVQDALGSIVGDESALHIAKVLAGKLKQYEPEVVQAARAKIRQIYKAAEDRYGAKVMAAAAAAGLLTPLWSGGIAVMALAELYAQLKSRGMFAEEGGEEGGDSLELAPSDLLDMGRELVMFTAMALEADGIQDPAYRRPSESTGK